MSADMLDDADAAQALAKATAAAEAAEALVIRQLQEASAVNCDASKHICVRWQNPDQVDLNMRGPGTAYRSNADNYAEVKTSGTSSNTFISITHNDNTAIMVIGDPNAILNTVTIKQNVGIARVVSR